MIKTAERDGWHAVRQAGFARDRGCIAVNRDVFGDDVATDNCFNKRGFAIRSDAIFDMEWEHVKEELGMAIRAEDDEAHGVICCPWHHRGSGWRVDSKAHRAKVRDWLAKHYPEVWGGSREDAATRS